ncbi:hypothetical protein IQ268_08010 [Oculatella sp. LEGE 06141]|uniref:hypothetical protein n=1 Tax=Oculatella sp. LEGE 06141 TaxID=1828648 RepID=UPI00187DE1C9|nr:hypothetical protein [Oculatella sp. LEGE 06141]MBE9178503.1 hypothetical protein [Oculatella sp. LEGE 06141]
MFHRTLSAALASSTIAFSLGGCSASPEVPLAQLSTPQSDRTPTTVVSTGDGNTFVAWRSLY